VSFGAITLCVASQRVFIVVYFVINSVQKILDTPSYTTLTKAIPGSGRVAPHILNLGSRFT
jgi:hypothetical protein